MAGRYTADLRHRALIQNALRSYEVKRDEFKQRYQSWGDARQAASEIKWEAINHLDRYLEDFITKLEARGTKVFVAGTAAQARDYIAEVAQENKVRTIIKSKSMTAEEIDLNEALEHAGCTVFESDLGEYIVQLRHEKPLPSRLPPAMHLTREDISTLFEKELGSAPTNSPEELTMIARSVMRKNYIEADMGLSGANFGIAETGMISITRERGQCAARHLAAENPCRHHGHRKAAAPTGGPRAFPAHARHRRRGAARSPATTRSTAGPRQPGEIDGPEQFHVVLLDNRRTRISRRSRAARFAPLHPLRRVPQRLPDLQERRRPFLRHDLPGPDRLGHHTESARDCKAGNISPTPRRSAARAPRPARSASTLHHHLLQNRRNATQGKPIWWERPALRRLRFSHATSPRSIGFPASSAKSFSPLQRIVKRYGARTPCGPGRRRGISPLPRGKASRIIGAKENPPRRRPMPPPDQRQEVFARIREALSVPRAATGTWAMSASTLPWPDDRVGELPGADVFSRVAAPRRQPPLRNSWRFSPIIPPP